MFAQNGSEIFLLSDSGMKHTHLRTLSHLSLSVSDRSAQSESLSLSSYAISRSHSLWLSLTLYCTLFRSLFLVLVRKLCLTLSFSLSSAVYLLTVPQKLQQIYTVITYIYIWEGCVICSIYLR